MLDEGLSPPTDVTPSSFTFTGPGDAALPATVHQDTKENETIPQRVKGRGCFCGKCGKDKRKANNGKQKAKSESQVP